MRERERVTFTNMCMIRDGNRVVVQKRVDPDWPGVAFPGGHVEAGESFTGAVIREVREETGLTIVSPRLCGVKSWYDESGRYVVLLYAAERFSGELISSDEGEVFWAELDALPGIGLASGMDETIRIYLDDDLSESYNVWQGDRWHSELK